MEVRTWLQKVELVANLQGVKDLAKFVPLFLSGGAFAVYQSINADERGNYSKVKAVLCKLFRLILVALLRNKDLEDFHQEMFTLQTLIDWLD